MNKKLPPIAPDNREDRGGDTDIGRNGTERGEQQTHLNKNGNKNHTRWDIGK